MCIQNKLKLIIEGTYDNQLNESTIGDIGKAVFLIAVTVLGISAIYKDSKELKEKGKLREEKVKVTNMNSRKKRDAVNEFLNKTPIQTLIKNVKMDIQKVITKLKSDKSFMDELYKMAPKDKFELVYNDQFDYIEVIDADQEYRIELYSILDKIVDIVKEKYAEPISLGILEITTGDGDEGCIYIESKYTS